MKIFRSVNPLYLMIGKVDGHIEENNGNKYLVCDSAELGKTYYQRNRDVILNRAKDYQENDKERLTEQARDKYKNLSEEERNKRREYGKNRYHNV